MRNIVFLYLSFLIFTAIPVFANDIDEKIFLQDVSLENSQDIFQPLQGHIEYEDPNDSSIYLNNLDDDLSLRIGGVKKVNARKITDFSSQNELEEKLYSVKPSLFSSLEYEIAPKNSGISFNRGAFTYGTNVDSSIDIGQLEQTTKLFTRYDAKHFAMSVSYGGSAKTTYGANQAMITFSPELKLGKGFALKESIRANFYNNSTKNEVSLLYRPHFEAYRDRMELEVGASQTQYQDSTQRYEVKFSTTFRL